MILSDSLPQNQETGINECMPVPTDQLNIQDSPFINCPLSLLSRKAKGGLKVRSRLIIYPFPWTLVHRPIRTICILIQQHWTTFMCANLDPNTTMLIANPLTICGWTLYYLPYFLNQASWGEHLTGGDKDRWHHIYLAYAISVLYQLPFLIFFWVESKIIFLSH